MLREKMNEQGVHAYIIPSTDPHLNEYVPAHYKSREWISGFTGSAGLVVVTHEKAILWTDGRYYIQAAKQIEDSEFEFYKMEKGTPNYIEFIGDTLLKGQKVGFDGKSLPCVDVLKMKKTFDEKGISIKSDIDLINEIWVDGRPTISRDKAFVHDVAFAGLSVKEKLEQVLTEMDKHKVNHYIVSALDSIAWFLNIRGNDVSYVPVVISYLLISKDSVTWFVDQDKLTDEIRDHLGKNDVLVKDYDSVFQEISGISDDSNILVDNKKNSYAIYSAVKDEKAVNKDDIIIKLKGVKNSVEIENMKETHIKDGVAMVNFLHWLDTNIGVEEITEIDIAQKLVELRTEQEHCLGASFDTIAGYNANAAMMHYMATPENYAVLKPEGVLLVDSGGQYLGGTTDITRTMVLGDISEEQIRDFTLVLKAKMAMSRAIFLEGSSGKSLDALARQPLWENHMNYKCGSGHGLGYCLSVHEGPHGFGVDVPFEEGMVVTIEPGVYKENRYGIRTENTLVVVKDKLDEDAGQFYRFDMLTYCPIDIRAIDTSLLRQDEIDWVNNYH
ncbi:MAG TPA: aminopeptidase P family protein, partial [Clostridia bacterium]|nr:aminopeptidase P family protein [Clostridia bacterium]